MGFATASAAIGIGISAVSFLGQANSGRDAQRASERTLRLDREANRLQANAEREIFQQNLKSQDLRQRAMKLQSARQQRNAIRQSQLARATANSAATNAGARGGSAFQGAMGQIAGQTGLQLEGVRTNEQFGEEQFGINNSITNTQFGLSQNLSRINRQRSLAQGDMLNAQADSQFWSSLSGLGGSLVQNSQQIGRVGGTLFGV